ncbi:MAG: tetratricopeptide repeat protein [Candidatus Hermodarchaeota archaeon]
MATVSNSKRLEKILENLQNQDKTLRLQAAKELEEFDGSYTPKDLWPILEEEIDEEIKTVLLRIFRTRFYITADSLNNQGVDYHNAGNYKEAMKLYKRTILIDPHYKWAYYNAGNISRSWRDLPAAVEYYQKALDIDPNYGSVLNNLGVTYRDMKNNEEAIKCFEKAINSPDYVSPELAWYNKAISLKDLARDEEAIECYKKAIEIKPDYKDALEGLARLYASFKSEDKLQLAIETYKKILDINPADPDVWNSLGTTYYALNQYMKAIEAYQKATEFEDYQYRHYPFYNIGLAYENLKRPLKAIESYRKAVKLYPEYLKAWVELSKLEKNLGNTQEAEKAASMALQIDINQADTLRNVGFNVEQVMGRSLLEKLLEETDSEKKERNDKKLTIEKSYCPQIYQESLKSSFSTLFTTSESLFTTSECMEEWKTAFKAISPQRIDSFLTNWHLKIIELLEEVDPKIKDQKDDPILESDIKICFFEECLSKWPDQISQTLKNHLREMMWKRYDYFEQTKTELQMLFERGEKEKAYSLLGDKIAYFLTLNPHNSLRMSHLLLNLHKTWKEAHGDILKLHLMTLAKKGAVDIFIAFFFLHEGKIAFELQKLTQAQKDFKKAGEIFNELGLHQDSEKVSRILERIAL